MALTQTSLIAFLGDTLGVDTREVSGDTLLFYSGLIDSESMVELVVFIESEEDFQFTPDDVSLDHLDSIHQILAFAKERRGR